MTTYFETISRIREWAIANLLNSNIHGVEHWDRVYDNGQKLANANVDLLVVGAFAYLHDVCRENDGEDIYHGLRASEKVDEIRSTLLGVFTDKQISILKQACQYHTTEHKTGNPTIDVCFDADRLDLWRVGIVPDPKRMATLKGAEIASNTDYSSLIESIVIDIEDDEYGEDKYDNPPKYIKNKYPKIPRKIKIMLYIVFAIAALVLIKSMHVSCKMSSVGTFETEKEDIIKRSNYLKEKLCVAPSEVLNAMPSGIGSQFQGEWALYSCSMYAKALENIAKLYPEMEDYSVEIIDKLIENVLSHELRSYDKERWGEDPIDGINGDESHISYYSHLAWMIGGFKSINGGTKYDDIYHELCAGMNDRITNSPILNVKTYPGEVVYVPDMLVAIVALKEYSDRYNGKYNETVNAWKQIMKDRFTDKETGLIMSFIAENGEYTPIKGSYSSLNTYYLTQVDTLFAREQYEKLKEYFVQTKRLAGLKEYYNESCWFGLDIDAGPIIMNLSPSGTAFALGPITYFRDDELRKSFLKTAEIAGTTCSSGSKSHYLLAEIALVGEAITLAMRTSYPYN